MIYLGAYQPRAPEEPPAGCDRERWTGRALARPCKPDSEHTVNFAVVVIEDMNYVQPLTWMMISDVTETLDLAHKNLFINCSVPLLAK